jgi:exopolysaccharide biosynthesis polyprenyl glycosylphosphotransferase
MASVEHTGTGASAQAARTPGHQTLRLLVAVGDTVAFASAALVIALLWSTLVGRRLTDAPGVALLVAATPVAWLGAAALTQAHSARCRGTAVDEMASVFRTSALAVAGSAVVAVGLGINVPRWWFVPAAIASSTAVVGLRLGVRRWLRFDHRRRWAEQLVLIVGAGPEGQAVAASFLDDPDCPYRAVGFIDDDLPPGTVLGGLPVVGDVTSTFARAADHGVSALVLTSALGHERVSDIVRSCPAAGLDVQLSSRLPGVRCGRLVPLHGGRQPLVHVEPPVHRGWRAAAKRTLDMALAVVGLVLISPIVLLAMLAVRLDSPGPAIFRQRRVGRDGEAFTMFKVRTMTDDAEERRAELLHRNEADGPLFKLRDDPRVTRVGRLLRKLSIDELPQLLNVLLGHMSLVGPRPALPDEVAAWSPEVHERLRVRPGITGLWQVSGRSDCSFDDYARFDLYYVDNWSLATDVAILVRTVPLVLLGHGAR